MVNLSNNITYMKLKHLLVVIAALALISVACGKKEAVESEPETFSVDSILAVASEYVGDTVTVKGDCAHLCKHGGTKAFLVGTDSTVILRCQATAAMGGAFAPDCVGKTLTVNGVVCEVPVAKPDSSDSVADSTGHNCATERQAIKAYYIEALSYSK